MAMQGANPSDFVVLPTAMLFQWQSPNYISEDSFVSEIPARLYGFSKGAHSLYLQPKQNVF